MKAFPKLDATQLVLQQMDHDPSQHRGVANICHRIAMTDGVILTKTFVRDIMQLYDEDGFALWNPGSKKVHCVAKVPLGIHERWSGDGHDKLYKIGFPIWAIVDDGTTTWLDAWVVPSNRMGYIIGYLFLCLVEKYGGKCNIKYVVFITYILTLLIGIPTQFTTDCGSETTQLYGLVNALR